MPPLPPVPPAADEPPPLPLFESLLELAEHEPVATATHNAAAPAPQANRLIPRSISLVALRQRDLEAHLWRRRARVALHGNRKARLGCLVRRRAAVARARGARVLHR